MCANLTYVNLSGTLLGRKISNLHVRIPIHSGIRLAAAPYGYIPAASVPRKHLVRKWKDYKWS